MNIEEKNTAILQKLIDKKPVYLLNEFRERALRHDPEARMFFAKAPGAQEYEVERGSNLVVDTLLESVEITKEEYRKF